MSFVIGESNKFSFGFATLKILSFDLETRFSDLDLSILKCHGFIFVQIASVTSLTSSHSYMHILTTKVSLQVSR